MDALTMSAQTDQLLTPADIMSATASSSQSASNSRVPSPMEETDHDGFTLSGPYIFPTSKLEAATDAAREDAVVPGRLRLILSYNIPSYAGCMLLWDHDSAPSAASRASWSHVDTSLTWVFNSMFELAADFVRFQGTYELVAGYLSPVSDAYKKQGLAKAHHRVRMCQLACDGVDWIMVDPYEALQEEYVPTAQVLDHFEEQLNSVRGGIENVDGQKVPVKIALLAGSDLIHTMSTPGVWAPEDLNHILGNFGAFIIEREGTDTLEALSSLSRWAENINVIPQTTRNDISSTKVRLLRKRDMSIRWLIPDSVREYIERHGLFLEERKPDQDATTDEKAKQKETDGFANHSGDS